MSLDRAKAYDILGVPRGASEADVRAAYKRLALKWHPDKHANDEAATEKFQEISAAYKYLTTEERTEHILTMDDMFELFAQIFFGSRASYNGYIDTSDEYDDDSDEDFWETVESRRRPFHRKTTEYSYTANRPTESEASKNAEELMAEEERQKKSKEKRKSKKKRQREKKREERARKEEEEARQQEEKQRQEEFLRKARESAEKAKREAELKQRMSQPTNSSTLLQGTTHSTSTGRVNHDTMSTNFGSSKTKLSNRVQEPSDPTGDDDIAGWDRDSAFFAGATANIKRSAPKADKAKKKGGGAKGQNEEAESVRAMSSDQIDNMDPIVLQSRQTAVKGNEMANLGHYSAAIELFTQAIELDPRDFRFFGNRSFCYDRLEEYESALKDANRAITLSKDWPKGHFRKGRALVGLKRFAEAEAAFEHVLKLDKNCEDAVEELHKVRVGRLMEMGFSRPQSDAAIRQYGSVQAALDALLTNGVEGVINSFPEDVYISDEEDYITETIERSKLDSCNPLNLRSIWVGNLHSTVSEKQLRDMFGLYGEIESLRRLPDRFCAFINYKRPEEAARALETLQGVELGGSFLLIKFPDNPILDGQPRTTVLKKINPTKQPKTGRASNDQNDSSGNKVTGPVNGNECYFWRTTGCVFGDRCKYKHYKESKGADIKPWQKVVYDN
ncbi:hsp70-Hsp90 organizing protein 1-like isoform X2 [Acanthaster planci]|uniref:Hsp70-Hsp90 organizing protein 1-like isoform X2 n=1 Tax=Acanthaster planci TaxID=133434 RepID=A0A8B7YY37_ACAPL|nr:hsp70-Hsp90 organizing protein 1-like isoform X2 [Acanthaster planci]